MRSPTTIKLGILSAWIFLITIIVMVCFPSASSSIFQPWCDAFFVALLFYFLGLFAILFSSMAARRPKKNPIVLSSAWQGLAIAHVLISLFIAAVVFLAHGITD